MTKAQIQKLLTAAVRNSLDIQAATVGQDNPQTREVYLKHCAYEEAFVACQKALKGDTIDLKLFAKI